MKPNDESDRETPLKSSKPTRRANKRGAQDTLIEFGQCSFGLMIIAGILASAIDFLVSAHGTFTNWVAVWILGPAYVPASLLWINAVGRLCTADVNHRLYLNVPDFEPLDLSWYFGLLLTTATALLPSYALYFLPGWLSHASFLQYAIAGAFGLIEANTLRNLIRAEDVPPWQEPRN